MPDMDSVLITGINGFIGTALSQAICAAGYDVWGIDVASNNNNQIIEANLFNIKEVYEAAKKIPPCSVLIHTAAIAHGQNPLTGETVLTINVKTTDNILKAFKDKISHIVFLSSVAVYGEDKRHQPVSINEELRPSTDYGKSKIQCENLILESQIENCNILRLAPVYDQNRLDDIRKRVFLPGLNSIKTVLKPSPQHSLLDINSIIQIIMHIISKGPAGHRIQNAADPKPYHQYQLASWFPGKKITLSVHLTKPIYWLTYLFPKKFGYKIRCFYWKFFRSNIYNINIEEVPRILPSKEKGINK